MRAPSIGLLEQLKIGSVTVKTSLGWGCHADEALKINNSKKLKCLHIFLEDGLPKFKMKLKVNLICEC